MNSTPEDWPVRGLGDVPTYSSFFFNHDEYERYHVRIVGVRPSTGTSNTSIANRKNVFGLDALVDKTPDPYIKLQTQGEDTGSTDFFPIGEYETVVLKDTALPIWDAKCFLLGKKEGTESIMAQVLDKNGPNRDDEVLMEVTIPRSDLPEAKANTNTSSDDWKELVFPGKEDGRMEGLELVLRVKVTDGADPIVSKEVYQAFFGNTEDINYSEQVLEDVRGEDPNPHDNSLLQCFAKEGNEKAVLWILGRNDCFMHPHAAKTLFLEKGFNVFVLNYKMNGLCRKQGWVQDPEFCSHNFSGSFDVYDHDIAHALEYIKDYKTILGYAHSTGGPILLNYLMHHGDAAFDGFIFNSPFLDWGFVGGDLLEFVLESMSVLTNLGTKDHNDKLDPKTTPEPLKDTPIVYLDKEVVLSAWSARIWSLYYFDWQTRPLYHVPMTVGFAKGVTRVHKAMEECHKKKRIITGKPFLTITARGDDVLKAPETLSRADWIGPNRSEIELNDNGHDIFLSGDIDDTTMAIDMVAAWMKNKHFYS